MSLRIKAASPDQAEFLAALIGRGLLLGSGGYRACTATAPRSRTCAAARGASQLGRGLPGSRVPALPAAAAPPPARAQRLLTSFPHLAGSVFAFAGDEHQAAQQAEQAARHEDWSEFQQMTELMLMPAACYPVYPAIAARGRLPEGGAFVDAGGAWVFRHEPSHDPARRQMFHMHELVRIGEPDAVLAWRDEWAQRGLELLRSLGLDAQLDNNDVLRTRRPDAGRQPAGKPAGKLMVQIAGPSRPRWPRSTTIVTTSGAAYGIELAGGGTAHTACLGFGQERVVVALLRTHGLDPEAWPEQSAPSCGDERRAGWTRPQRVP